MKKILKNSRPNGVHFLMEFFGCDKGQIDNIKFWEKILEKGIRASGIKILDKSFYKFKPQGVTGFLLLEASHVSVHTWPEYNYVACDIFSCAPYDKTREVAYFLIKNIRHEKMSVDEIKRGYKYFDFKKYINKKKELIVPVYASGEQMKIKIKEILEGIKSSFQDILFIDTDEFGKCLIIDGIMQSAESDHKIYDKAILRKLKKRDQEILILGGGDGYVAEEALNINPDLKVRVVDLDAEVVKGCENFLNQRIFKDSRVKLCIEDAFKYLKEVAKEGVKLDGVAIDLTDEPIRKKDQKDFRKFYKEVISLSKDALNDNGWISLQAGASRVIPEHMDAVSILEKILKKSFKDISRKDKMIPSFGEKNAFLYARK